MSDLSSGSLGLDAPSLSRRRQATNKPTLDCHLPLPPTPAFDNPKLPVVAANVSDFPLVNKRGRAPVAKLAIDDALSSRNDDMPITPADQIAHAKHTPPNAPRQTV
ncbi:uncharacterized protein PHACADRAFT_266387, partial [Phanerochaete carnosa HHB-10118-sp]